MDILQSKGQRFNNTSGQATDGSASISQAGSSGRTYYVTDLSGSSSATAVIRLFSGATDFWQGIMVNSNYIEQFKVPIAITIGSAVEAEVKNDTTSGSAFVNVSGYFIG